MLCCCTEICYIHKVLGQLVQARYWARWQECTDNTHFFFFEKYLLEKFSVIGQPHATLCCGREFFSREAIWESPNDSRCLFFLSRMTAPTTFSLSLSEYNLCSEFRYDPVNSHHLAPTSNLVKNPPTVTISANVEHLPVPAKKTQAYNYSHSQLN